MAGEETFKQQQKRQLLYYKLTKQETFQSQIKFANSKFFHNVLIEGFVLAGWDVTSLGISFPKLRRNASSSSPRFKLHKDF